MDAPSGELLPQPVRPPPCLADRRRPGTWKIRPFVRASRPASARGTLSAAMYASCRSELFVKFAGSVVAFRKSVMPFPDRRLWRSSITSWTLTHFVSLDLSSIPTIAKKCVRLKPVKVSPTTLASAPI